MLFLLPVTGMPARPLTPEEQAYIQELWKNGPPWYIICLVAFLIMGACGSLLGLLWCRHQEMRALRELEGSQRGR